MMTTSYTTLDRTQPQIRLLELHPGSYDDELIVSLHVERLGSLPEFYALSYAWGHEIAEQRALVNGVSSAVGYNLDCALRHIRWGLSRPKLLWVDALCINQRDLGERSSQVLLMKDIYSSAERVLIWLGSQGSADELLESYIQSGKIPRTDADVMTLLWYLDSTCRLPWFGRVWVAQELALSLKDPVVYLGKTTFPWSQFNVYVHRLADEMPGSLRRHPLSYAFFKAMDSVTRLGRIRTFHTASLTLQVHRTASSRATDPKDKVFGLLGICAFAPGQTVVVPDYTKSIQEVFTEATISMLQEGDNLPYSLLPLLPPRNPKRDSLYQALPGLPSWVLDLNISSQASTDYPQNYPSRFIPECALDLDQLLQPSNHIPHRVRASHGLQRLHTQGKHIGTIVNRFASPPDLSRHNRDCQGRATALRDIYNNCMKPRQIPTDVLLQALTIDGMTTVDNPQLAPQLPHLFEQLLLSHTCIEAPSPFFDVLVALSNKDESILFVTDQNQVGITYHCDLEDGVRIGDEIVGLFGVNYPFVLRAVPGGLDGRPAYTMINVAHVASHRWGHDFLENARVDARWSDFIGCGLNEYTIV